MGEDVWVAIIAAIGVVVSAVAAALSAWGIARINATKADVGHAKDQAEQANEAAVAARDYSKPMGNGYAEESRAAWRRIESQGQRTHDLITRHLEDHAAAGMGALPRHTEHDVPPTGPRE
jgi:aromatic ring hydroxylase